MTHSPLHKVRFSQFIQWVFGLSVFSFGGPQAHYLMMKKLFVDKYNIMTHDDFTELMSLCQALPGPSSTQFLTLVAFRLGGMRWAFVTLVVWALPACLLMFLCSLLISYIHVNPHLFDFTVAFALGLLGYHALDYALLHIRKPNNIAYTLGLSLLVMVGFRSPWIFPIVLVLSGLIGYWSYTDHKDLAVRSTEPIKKRTMFIFIVVFVIAGVLSEQARINHWVYRKPINLFENTYRFGSTVFGGGPVLSSMMYEQYAVRQQTQYIAKEDAMIGVALSQTTPGPVFAYATFIGSLIFKNQGLVWQMVGALIATIGIFLPGFLIGVFCFQLLSYLKKYNFVLRLMNGIHLNVSAVLIGSFVFLIHDNHLLHIQNPFHLLQMIYLCVVIWVLKKKYLSLPFLFFVSLLLGLIIISVQ